MLMLLVFFVDQVQEMACKKFKRALKAVKRHKYLWERVIGIFFNFQIISWDSLYGGIADFTPDNRPVWYDSS